MRELSAVRSMFSNRSLLTAMAGFAAFSLVFHGSWVVVMVYAFNRGGVSEAGVVSLVLLVPASIAGPFVAVAFDRLPPNRALAGGYAAQAVTIGVVALSISTDMHAAVVYAAIAAFAVTQMASRPTLSAVLPRVSTDPTELAAANSAMGLFDTLGLFLGPAGAGVVLYLGGGLAAPFAASAILMVAATLFALPVRHDGETFGDSVVVPSVVAEVRSGLDLLRRDAPTRHLVALQSVGKVIVGALEVGVVAVAVDHLGRSEATVGLLASAIGVGAVIGAMSSFVLIGRRRLSSPLALGLLAMAMPLALVASTNSIVAVVGLLTIAGVGRPFLEVSGRTLLQGLSADDTLAQIFGFLEGLSLLAMAVGSLGFSQLVVLSGLKTALVVVGIIPLVVLAISFGKLRAIDASRPLIDPDLLALAQRVPIFAPLPAFRIEQMLLNMRSVEFEADRVVFNEGDAGHLVYVVAGGSALIELKTRVKETLPGGFFGEIALIRDQPRMATVRAGAGGLRAFTLERSVFLDAISTTTRSATRTERIVEHRMNET